MSEYKVNVSNKTIVFVAEYPRARIFKIAWGLRKNGWRTILLCRYNHSEYDPNLYFHEYGVYSNTAQVHQWAKNYPADVFHVFSSYADELSVEFCRDKPGKVIFDPYDFAEGLGEPNQRAKVINELIFCLSNADAICLRDLRAKYFAKEHKFNLARKVIFYPDYCWDDQYPFGENSKLKDGIHLAIAGFITTPQTTESDWGILEMAEKFCKQEIFFHVYPHPMQFGSPTFESDFAVFRNFASENSYFKLHNPVKMDEMVKELSRYHFGLNAHWKLVNNQDIPNYSNLNLEKCFSARNFDYLDSNLMVILNKCLKFQYWLLDRYSLAIDASRSFLDNPRSVLEAKLEDEKIANKVKLAKNYYSIKNNIQRYIDFISSF